LQFHTHNKRTDKLEREAHQRITAAPRYAYTTSILTQARALHLPFELDTLPVDGRAAQYRMAMQTSELYPHLLQLLLGVVHMTLGDEMGTEYRLGPLMTHWWPHSIMAQITRAVRGMSAVSPTLYNNPPTTQLQRKVSNALNEHANQETPQHLLCRRRVRFPGAPEEHGQLFKPIRAHNTIALARHPFLCSTTVKTLVNGWCTAHRFQKRQLPCLFGCGHNLGDNIRHYCHCPVIITFYTQAVPLLPPLPSEGPPLQFLALRAPPDPDHIIPVAILLHITFLAYEGLRHQQRTTTRYHYHNQLDKLHQTPHLLRLKYPGLMEILLQWYPYVRGRNETRHMRPEALDEGAKPHPHAPLQCLIVG